MAATGVACPACSTEIRVLRELAPIGHADMAFWYYAFTGATGAMRLDAAAVRDSAEILELAERRGDDLSVWSARFVHGFILAQQPEPDRGRGLTLLAPVREAVMHKRSIAIFLPLIDIEFAKERAQSGHIDEAVAVLTETLRQEGMPSGGFGPHGRATEVLVEMLLQRGRTTDIADAREAIDRLAAFETEPGVVVNATVLLRLRALLARACGDEAEYRQHRDRYRAMANEIGFERHIAVAEAMT
jgi:adenylate cyclase